MKSRKRGSERSPSIPESQSVRVNIENVKPEIDGGRYPAKRTLGEKIEVSADVFTDGHDLLTVYLRYRPRDAAKWSETPMEDRANDRFCASFEADSLGFYEYTIVAWIDRFRGWQRDLSKKFQAKQQVGSELLEGAEMVAQAARRAQGSDAAWLAREAKLLSGRATAAKRVAAALATELTEKMAAKADRSSEVTYPRTLPLWVDRKRARYGAWYEMFPRSAGTDPIRGATLREAALRLPGIAAMGFDVLYLPPVHPIGKTHRKGPNNALEAGPGDPGSPWAIGSSEGSHKAVHPQLGTLTDFDAFVAEAGKNGLEVALDIAFQCSPDHPYVREHPEWFRHRPDGTIKYAENPPKKYQDIYPFDFECPDWRGLWHELLDVVLFWTSHGVRIFRVDNPHTKSFGFWEWLIREVQAAHPDVIFLAEAFTRPKVMRQLGKRGFTQSYTYFTWRNRKEELTEYMTELTRTDLADCMRPNLFVNTPDIFHEYLQFGGRPAFQARLVLAATLGASYGIYGPPFELCEGGAIPGTEEYQDSEKYQIRVWDWDQPGNIKDFIRRVNRIRAENPALHRNESLEFHLVENDQLIAYSKTNSNLSNVVLVVVNLDPYQIRSGEIRVPLASWGLTETSPYQLHDLLSDARYSWQGESNRVILDPRASPAHIFRLRRKLRTERDFDYFL